MNALSLPPGIDARVLRNEPMARHTSWKVGGPADLFFRPLNANDLAAFLETLGPDTPIVWVGLGSNLLVRDGGLRAAVIETFGAFGELDRLNQTDVWAGAGVSCAKLARQCVRWGLGPAEFFAGIPGTVGGALAMNAGAFGGETWRHVVEVETINRRGQRQRRPASDYRPTYRHLDGPRDEWFLGCLLRFEPRRDSNENEIRRLLTRRKETQPIGELSCGSVFTNPAGDHAARLIEAAGLKGFRIGGAQVSEKHANFIINDGTATATDLEQLIEHVRQTVAAVHGVSLQPEVHIVGEPLPAGGRT
jgi:UDP-N-acetylmuramate dehydrogenase